MPPAPDAATAADPVALLSALIRCPSVTPTEGGALALLESVLAPAGFTVSRPVFREAGTPDVENLFATIGSGAPHLVFAGHTDVVPPGDPARWSHGPFAGDISDGFVHGRGAVDMKGGIAAFVAAALGYHFVDQPGESAALWANAILSRYPLGTLTPNKLGARISVDGRAVDIFNVHFTDFPYQPYQALGIEYGNAPFLKTAGELVTAAAAARGPGLALLFADMDAAGPADAAFVFGDFNEPSHHDWVDATVKAGLQPLVVPYPTEKAIEARGFVDTFRAVYPDPVAKPGLTWTPTTSPSDKDDHHDRIDFALAKAEKLEVLSAGILGEKAPEADIVVTPWPSDHRATFAKVRF